MDITTTVRKAALMRLVTFSAPGNIDVRKALRKLRLKIEKQGAAAFAESETMLVPTGGFTCPEPGWNIDLDFSDMELRRLDLAFDQAVWDPRTIPEVLEDIIWELADEIKEWVEDAQAQRIYDRLTEKQKAAVLKDREEKVKKEGKDE